MLHMKSLLNVKGWHLDHRHVIGLKNTTKGDIHWNWIWIFVFSVLVILIDHNNIFIHQNNKLMDGYLSLFNLPFIFFGGEVPFLQNCICKLDCNPLSHEVQDPEAFLNNNLLIWVWWFIFLAALGDWGKGRFFLKSCHFYLGLGVLEGLPPSISWILLSPPKLCFLCSCLQKGWRWQPETGIFLSWYLSCLWGWLVTYFITL